MDLSGSWQYIEAVARSRLAHNKTAHHVSRYGESIEQIGVAGEIIVRRFLGLPEQVHDRFDHGVDIYYYNMRIDVKATNLTPNAYYRFLQWPTWKTIRSDYIVMTCIDPLYRAGTIIGYTTRQELLAAPVNKQRQIACHEIPFTSLHPTWELVVEATRQKMLIEEKRFPALETPPPNQAASSTLPPSKRRDTATELASRG